MDKDENCSRVSLLKRWFDADDRGRSQGGLARESVSSIICATPLPLILINAIPQ